MQSSFAPDSLVAVAQGLLGVWKVRVRMRVRVRLRVRVRMRVREEAPTP